jgi:hypothetical protein
VPESGVVVVVVSSISGSSFIRGEIAYLNPWFWVMREIIPPIGQSAATLELL